MVELSIELGWQTVNRSKFGPVDLAIGLLPLENNLYSTLHLNVDNIKRNRFFQPVWRVRSYFPRPRPDARIEIFFKMEVFFLRFQNKRTQIVFAYPR